MLRIVTLNLWGLSEPLTARLELAARQLRALAPDVVCLQEVRPLVGLSGPTTADQLGMLLGLATYYAEHTRWDAHTWPGQPAGAEGLAILSALPIQQIATRQLPYARSTEGRILQSAQVQTAHGPIWVHNTHLHYRLDDGRAREAQVLEIDEFVRSCGRGNHDAPQVLCGDFNAIADADEMRFLRGLTTLGDRRTHFQDAWLRLHREPGPGDGPQQGITWSSENAQTRALRSLDIDRRIDYIYVTSRKRDGRATVHACQVCVTDVADIDGGICASDHYGVMADVQIAATAL